MPQAPLYGGGGGGGPCWKASAAPISSNAYVDGRLRPVDVENYAGAALVPYRQVGESIELLLAWERPWNTFTNRFDTLSWTVLGGKRVGWQESLAEITAIRTFLEVMDGIDVPDMNEMVNLTSKSFVLWYPTGKYALVFFEATDGLFSDLPEKFQEAKAQSGPQQEFKMLACGVRKWTKQIDELEWVPASSLHPMPAKDCSNLVNNILQVKTFQNFLVGELDPRKEFPSEEDVVVIRKKALNKGKGGGGKGGKGGYKGRKAAPTLPTGCMKGGCAPFMGNRSMVVPQPVYVHQEKPAGEAGMLLRMYGEQLYLLIQPLVPSQFWAQKITGMLLELPENELVLNLTNPEELQRRVSEALTLLKEEGVCGPP